MPAEPSPGKSGSLKRQASLRLVLGLSIALVLAGATAFWFYNASYEKAAAQKVRDVTEHYATRIGQLENEWESEAMRLKTRLEYSRMLEDRERRWVSLNSYMIAQSGSRLFSNVLIASRDGQVMYRYGVNADKLPPTLHQEGYIGWHHDAARGVLCRVYRQPVWLGGDGMGWLYLFRPLDNALLYANIFPGTRLFLSWNGIAIASSLGGNGMEINPSFVGAVYHGRQRYEQIPLPWGGNNTDVLLVVQQLVERPFILQEMLYSGTLVILLLSVFLWMVLGHWLTEVVVRAGALRNASRTFSAERVLKPEIVDALDAARAGEVDELSDVADALGELMLAIRRGDAELARQMEKLKQLNDELNEFTYIASHDLQEPLRKLVIFSEWLVRDLGADLPERAAKDLTFISEAAQRMRALVQELLNLSRAGNRELKSEAVSLETIADQALEALALQVEESRAVITRDPLPEVQGDAVLLTQLYQNLISNALKYSEEFPPRIHLDAVLRDGKWLLGVRDNGIGINPEYAEQIFQPFKRLHGQGKFEGTGIGLAICRKVVERHHGRIWVESEEGKGAHFRFTLPAKEQET